MTDISVTESLVGLPIPYYTTDRLIRNERGQVIQRDFFIVSDAVDASSAGEGFLVARLTQTFDSAGFLQTRHFVLQNADPRVFAREQHRLNRMREYPLR